VGIANQFAKSVEQGIAEALAPAFLDNLSSQVEDRLKQQVSAGSDKASPPSLEALR